MTPGVRSIVSNVTCDDAAITGGDETHVREPIRKHTTQGFHTSRIPMYHYRENATGRRRSPSSLRLPGLKKPVSR